MSTLDFNAETKARVVRAVFDLEVFPIAPTCDDTAPVPDEDEGELSFVVFGSEFTPQDYVMELGDEGVTLQGAPPGDYTLWVTMQGEDRDPEILYHFLDKDGHPVNSVRQSLQRYADEFLKQSEELYPDQEMPQDEQALEEMDAEGRVFEDAFNFLHFRELFQGVVEAQNGFWHKFPAAVDNVTVVARKKMELALIGKKLPVSVQFESPVDDDDAPGASGIAFN